MVKLEIYWKLGRSKIVQALVINIDWRDEIEWINWIGSWLIKGKIFAKREWNWQIFQFWNCRLAGYDERISYKAIELIYTCNVFQNG